MGSLAAGRVGGESFSFLTANAWVLQEKEAFLRVVLFTAAFHSVPRLAPEGNSLVKAHGDPEKEAFEHGQNAFPLAEITIRFAECEL